MKYGVMIVLFGVNAYIIKIMGGPELYVAVSLIIANIFLAASWIVVEINK